jgi:hypothetical protein
MGIKDISAAQKLGGIQLSESLGAAARMTEAFRSQRDIADALVPPGIRTMIDMQRSIQQLARPFAGPNFDIGAADLPSNVGLGRFAMHDASADLHRQLARTTQVFEVGDKFGAMQKSIAGLVADQGGPWRDIARLTKSFGMATPVTHQFSRISDFDRTLRHLVPEAAHLAWSDHLKTTALGTLGFLRQDWGVAVGLLTQVDRTLGGSVAWLTQHRDTALLMTAALAPAAETDGGCEVLIEDEYVCAICEGPMVTFGANVRWLGPRRGVRRRRIFPICSTCWEQERDDEGFLHRALCDLTRPAVRVVPIRGVITGGGQGDGRPKGALRLVRCAGEDRDD